jgi:MFS family permease
LIFSHLPNALVAGLLIGLQLAAGATAYADWVSRVPFLAGGLIGIVGFWLRRNLDEPDEFKQATRRTDSKNPLLAAIRAGGLKSMLHVAMIQPIQTVGSYLLLGYMYTFLVRVAKLDPTSALLTNGAAIVVLSFMIPLGGVLSDRFGRKPILSFGAAWLVIAAYPGVYLAASGTITGALLGQILLVVGVGLYGGACFVAAPEFFPTSFRATGHAISYQLSVAVFGGTTPFIGTLLVQVFGSPLAPRLLCCVCRGCMSHLRLLDLNPDQDSRAFLAGHWVFRGQRSYVQGVAVDSELTHLRRPCPRLIPRCINMVANFVALNTVGPRVCDKPAVEIDALRVGWNESVRRLSPLLNQDGVHPAVRPIAEIAAWVRAEQIGLLAGRHVFSREGV